jgi:hypothetical protein
MHPDASGFYPDAARCRRSSKSCRNMHWMHSPKVQTLKMSFVDSLPLENPKSIGRKKKKKKKKKNKENAKYLCREERPPPEALLKTHYFRFYSAVSIGTILFTVLCLPETKDKGLEEISSGFAKSNPSQANFNKISAPTEALEKIKSREEIS